jgi:hypothetical protein
VHVAKPGTVVSISEMTFDGVSVEELSELTAQAHVMRICESEGLPVVAVEVTRGRVKGRGGDGELRMAALVAFDCEATAKRAEVELQGRPEFRQGRISPCTAHQLTTRIAYRGMSCFTHVWLCRNFLDCSLIFALFFSFRTRGPTSTRTASPVFASILSGVSAERWRRWCAAAADAAITTIWLQLWYDALGNWSFVNCRLVDPLLSGLLWANNVSEIETVRFHILYFI